ncbi:hypothetical protein J0383_18830 [Flavobacterium endoglycinae]|uniref:Lipocalin-like domain-containing protein n=1 Tax=Flavobacterium endoglycinae TaxID=2816357 RepID=A0ABX7QB93_9FLAO|nr:hypothetical protein [Flavobacterium endoglycinae]QSW88305.1 hypothetical protein J0383_18830 [Flavobacterium endoglycinae]
MKKIYILLLTTLIIFSCSSSEDSNSKNNSLNPPAWIQGTWAQKYGSNGSYTYQPTFIFTKNDFCTISLNSSSCISESLNNTPDLKINESRTNSEYKFSLKTNGVTTSYRFIKVSDSKIEYDIYPDQNVPNMELFKQ